MPGQTIKVQTPENTITQDAEGYSGLIIPKLVWLQEGVSQEECDDGILGNPINPQNLYKTSELEEGNLIGIRTPEFTAYPLRIDSADREAGDTKERGDTYKVILSRSNTLEIILDFKVNSKAVVVTEKTQSGSSTYSFSEDDIDVLPVFDKTFTDYYGELEQFVVERM